MSLEKCLQDLSDTNIVLTYQVLTELSDLSSLQVVKFVRVWNAIPPERKRDVIERLVGIAEESAELDFNAVFQACLKDSDAAVREKAISGLWEFEDRSIIPLMIDRLKCDSASAVRAAAAVALGKFAELAQQSKLLSKDGERVKGALMSVLLNEAEETEVRRRALEAVAPFNTSQVREYIRWAYGSSNLQLKCSSLYAMGKTGDSEWLTLLIRELKSSTPAIRYEAANGCGQLGEEEAVPYLIPLLQDDDLQVQQAAISALGVIGGPLAKRALKRCLRMGDPALEDAAREALANMEVMEDPLTFKSEN